MISQTFTPVSPQRWKDIKVALAGYGFVIDLDVGTGSKDGVNFSWLYLGEKLTITVLYTSFVDDMVGEDEQAVMDQITAKIGTIQ